jgi:hypothetical protein
MKQLLRPSVLVAVLLALIVGGVTVWFRFRPEPTGPVPLPVAPGDREIVWLYQATGTANWERFVTAVQLTADRLRDELPGVRAEIDDRAFPDRSTAVPEVALTWDGAGGRLVFRWYKLTSDWKPRDWVEALLKDRPPPLAIIGGNNSELARDLAVQLRTATADLDRASRPLLLLTTATADLVDWPADVPQPANLEFQPADAEGRPPRVHLNAIYPRRTFRFCFSNRQMSETVTQFLHAHDDVRPDGEDIYMVQWKDDAYSRDLIEGFVQSCSHPPGDVVPAAAALGALRSAPVPVLAVPALLEALPPLEPVSFHLQPVESSFGTAQTPNRFEADCVHSLLDAVESTGVASTPSAPAVRRRRSLLVVAGQTPPTRRFLRELARTDPKLARGFVVATGDSLAFNTIYRDRLITWPIQDLPYPLVAFSHANPVDPAAGFRPHPEGRSGATTVGDSGATGTEDVLLFAEIVGAVARGAALPGGGLGSAPRLAERLRAARHIAGRVTFGTEGVPLFAEDGDRADGTGEHVVCLRPQFQSRPGMTTGGRTLPLATIEVWTGSGSGARRTWERCCEPLVVSYE